MEDKNMDQQIANLKEELCQLREENSEIIDMFEALYKSIKHLRQCALLPKPERRAAAPLVDTPPSSPSFPAAAAAAPRKPSRQLSTSKSRSTATPALTMTPAVTTSTSISNSNSNTSCSTSSSSSSSCSNSHASHAQTHAPQTNAQQSIFNSSRLSAAKETDVGRTRMLNSIVDNSQQHHLIVAKNASFMQTTSNSRHSATSSRGGGGGESTSVSALSTTHPIPPERTVKLRTVREKPKQSRIDWMHMRKSCDIRSLQSSESSELLKPVAASNIRLVKIKLNGLNQNNNSTSGQKPKPIVSEIFYI